ncbi:MAG TPA: thiamine phosphate synthase [Terriglobales bacterium]|nr:thiamine phosphate synthase [Terriglobales bacterium]
MATTASFAPQARNTVLPRLYAILDVPSLDAAGLSLPGFASSLLAGGVSLLQYRNKQGESHRMLQDARQLRELCHGRAKLIMNDRADFCLAAGFDGVHLGRDDLNPWSARTLLGKDALLGVSAHDARQVEHADQGPADYIAIGPVFATSSKRNPDPTVGLAGVRAARNCTQKPLVAIGGVTRSNCRAVLEAGADAVAVISDLIVEPARSVEEFQRLLG